MSSLWLYKNSDIYDTIDTAQEDEEFYIYDTRDPESNTTRWISAEPEDIIDLTSAI